MRILRRSLSNSDVVDVQPGLTKRLRTHAAQLRVNRADVIVGLAFVLPLLIYWVGYLMTFLLAKAGLSPVAELPYLEVLSFLALFGFSVVFGWRPQDRMLAIGCVAVGLICLLTNAFVDGGWVRLLVSMVMYLTPAAAVLLSGGLTPIWKARILRLLMWLAALQIPLFVLQGLNYWPNVNVASIDRFTGSLPLKGGFIAPVFVVMVAALICFAETKLVLKLVVGMVAVAATIVASADQLLIVIVIGTVVYIVSPARMVGEVAAADAVWWRSRPTRRSSVFLILSGAVALVVLLAAAYSGLLVNAWARVSGGTGKPPVAAQLLWPWSDFWMQTPGGFLLGTGSGNSVSQLAYLLDPVKGTSSLRVLGEARYYSETITYAGGEWIRIAGSSISLPNSTLMGVLGDFGLFALLAFCFMIYRMLFVLCRRTEIRFVLAIWLPIVFLSFFSTLYEFTSLMITAVAITAVAEREKLPPLFGGFRRTPLRGNTPET